MADARPALADVAVSRIRGCTQAQKAISEIHQGCSNGDVLLDALRAVLAADDHEQLVGFMDELRKFVERGRP